MNSSFFVILALQLSYFDILLNPYQPILGIALSGELVLGNLWH